MSGDIVPMAFAPQHDELPDARLDARPPAGDPEVARLVRALVERVEADREPSPSFVSAWRRRVGAPAPGG